MAIWYSTRQCRNIFSKRNGVFLEKPSKTIFAKNSNVECGVFSGLLDVALSGFGLGYNEVIILPLEMAGTTPHRAPLLHRATKIPIKLLYRAIKSPRRVIKLLLLHRTI